MGEPENVGVQLVSASFQRYQSLLDKLLLTSTGVSRRNGTDTVAHIHPKKHQNIINIILNNSSKSQ